MKIAILAAAAIGALSLVMAALSPSHVTDQGVLVEPFAWMVIGRLSLVAAALGLAVLLVRRLYQQR